MAIEKTKLRKIADRIIDKVHFCYFNEGDLQVIDVMTAGIKCILH